MRRRENGNACGGGGCERNYADSDNVTIHHDSLGREHLFGFSLGISVEEEEEDVTQVPPSLTRPRGSVWVQLYLGLLCIFFILCGVGHAGVRLDSLRREVLFGFSWVIIFLFWGGFRPRSWALV